jgi:hypothetical protein
MNGVEYAATLAPGEAKWHVGNGQSNATAGVSDGGGATPMMQLFRGHLLD